MPWRKLITRRWPILALALFGLVGAVAIAQAAREPFFVLADEKDYDDEPGWLGVYIDDIDSDLAKDEDLPSTDGVYVSGTVDDSPAEDAGLKAGDVIVKFDGQEVRSVRRLTRMIEDTKPHTKVDIEILRDGKQHVLACEIGSSDNDAVWSWNFNGPSVRVPRAPAAPGAPDAPDTPRPPRAYSFSLGQLSSSYIGVGLLEMSDQLAEALGASEGGALINEVENGSPAEKAGLLAGDIIVEVDHKRINDNDDVRRAIQKKKDGEVATIRVMRGRNEDKTVDVTVESNDTWSGVGAPRRFHMAPGYSGSFEWQDDLHENLGELKRNLGENSDEWREQLQEQMKELREQMKELREQLRDNR